MTEVSDEVTLTKGLVVELKVFNFLLDYYGKRHYLVDDMMALALRSYPQIDKLKSRGMTGEEALRMFIEVQESLGARKQATLRRIRGN